MGQILYQLNDEDLAFPSPELALNDPNGLLAVGGDLSAERLLQAYLNGIFPWYSQGDPILWWSPNPRAIIEITNLKINRTLQKVINRGNFTITINQDFKNIIKNCANAPFRTGGTWIVNDIQQAYIRLHQLGYAHSVEVWQNNELAGGLYGVAINGYFCGESMYYQQPNASKLALVGLAQHLAQLDIEFIDCQLLNPFLAAMGAIEISRRDFIKRMKNQLKIKCPDNFWQTKIIKSK